ncbi:MAG TPA: RNA polymerase sigma factor [Ktedonobacteraceae bacterium]|jgi:RNA polymerase sigma-70 factor (ECF subfamily)
MNQGEANLSVLLATDLDRHFPELVLTYQHRLYSFALRQTGSQQDAEDIVQEAFMQAYYALAGYSVERRHLLTLQPWLYKITLNIFYSRMRQSKLSLVSLDMQKEGSHAAIEDDESTQPAIIAEGNETLREMAELLVKLPVQYREAVNLYYFAGLSYREMADLLNQPMGTIKSNLHRGIRLLRQALMTRKSEAR